MATQADYGWELPDLSDIADGPDAFLQFADDIAATVSDKSLLTYTPSWTAYGSGAVNPTSPASRSGFYTIRNGVCSVNLGLIFGPSTSGGNGSLAISLPAPGRSDIPTQLLPCSLYTPGYGGSVWSGFGIIDLSGSFGIIRPYFPLSTARGDALAWASYGSPTGGRAIPFSDAYQYSVQNGGWITAQGEYFIA